MQISENTVVQIHYTLKNQSGEVLDSSQDAEPLTYLHGAGNIIPGLETALSGREQGEKVNVTVEPDEAYGAHREELVQQVGRDMFPVDELEAGMRFKAETAEGPQILTVTKVEDSDVTVDANHPLAGETLHFDVEVVEIREASSEEVEHGHVHTGDEQQQQ
jgi:FKBP-type peptidyl-prolyl cis-trans isomerase SlyD